MPVLSARSSRGLTRNSLKLKKNPPAAHRPASAPDTALPPPAPVASGHPRNAGDRPRRYASAGSIPASTGAPASRYSCSLFLNDRMLIPSAIAACVRLPPVCFNAARIACFSSSSSRKTCPAAAVSPEPEPALARAGWSVAEVDLWEVNEAFAVVPMAFMRELNVAPEKLNVRGGAIALGHPIGCSGARIIVTLLAALKERSLKRGVAAICIGGGEGLAVCVELV